MSKTTVLWEDRPMKENTLPLSTFVSPRTGTEYLVVAKPQRRMRGGILEGCPMYWADYTQYDIVLNGNPVTFCFREEDIATSVEWFEYPNADVGSRFD
jgi:hypothetical protein